MGGHDLSYNTIYLAVCQYLFYASIVTFILNNLVFSDICATHILTANSCASNILKFQPFKKENGLSVFSKFHLHSTFQYTPQSKLSFADVSTCLSALLRALTANFVYYPELKQCKI